MSSPASNPEDPAHEQSATAPSSATAGFEEPVPASPLDKVHTASTSKSALSSHGDNNFGAPDIRIESDGASQDPVVSTFDAPPPQPTLPLSTPLPPSRNVDSSAPGPALIPDAPRHQPPVKGLPLSTPASSATPTMAGLSKQSHSGLDLAEFDPFATPAPAPASASASVATGAGAGAKASSNLVPSPSTPAKPSSSSAVTTAATAAPISSNATPSSASSQSQKDSGGAITPRRRQPSDVEREDQGGQSGVIDTPAGAAGGGSGAGAEKEASFNFSGFLKDLRTKSAEPVAKYLKSFLSNFAKKPFTVNEQIKLIHDFLAFISNKMLEVEPWKSQSSAEFDNAVEAMEKLVMNRLYNYTFTPQLVPSQPITTDDLERDAVFAQRVRLFGWIREKHLDVPEGEATQGFLGFAEQELLKINHYKAPRDKMICILNCCKVIFGLIRNAYGVEAAGADAFVPILIFVVIQANPENMLSNIEYISRFRSASKLQGEAGYYLSSLSGAIAFIETMDASSLSNITQAEFEKNVEDAIQELPPSPSASTSRALPPADMSPFSAVASGEEAAKPLSLTTTVQAIDGTKRFFQRTGNLAGNLASEAVSKPLNAIGKILEGMQTANDDRSEDGSATGSGEERSPERRPRPENPTPSSRDVFWSRRAPFNRATSPESPSRTLQGFGLGVPGDGSAPASRAGTPTPGDGLAPDFSSLQLQSTLDISQEAYAQTRRANVQTLHQMFPALDEDVVEAVLEGCGDDLGIAIDRLLEM
ncbi:hypothetical protein I317_07320 [Kwoniella heveanensis CBS 569]|nr:hypothetical protein I317_07320 [Kwoniella heveanensis CBS 569]